MFGSSRMLNQIVLLLLLFSARGGLFNPYFPDALACTGEYAWNMTATTVYWTNTWGSYCQAYALESRCVVYHGNGSYSQGTGNFQARKGCSNKTIQQVCSEGRCFDLVDSAALNRAMATLRGEINPIQNFTQSLSSQVNQTTASLTNLEAEVRKLKDQLNQNQKQITRAY